MDNYLNDYLRYVSDTISKYRDNYKLINNNEINPIDINKCLANYMEVLYILTSEYQRVKAELLDTQNEFDKWYDEKFVKLRISMENENDKNTKHSLKEIETQLRYSNKEEYYLYQEKIKVADMKVRYLLRILDGWKKFDSILTTLSNNLRTEMRALSIENRVNEDPNKNKVRTRLKLND